MSVSCLVVIKFCDNCNGLALGLVFVFDLVVFFFLLVYTFIIPKVILLEMKATISKKTDSFFVGMMKRTSLCLKPESVN